MPESTLKFEIQTSLRKKSETKLSKVELRSVFYTACALGDLDKVKECIEKGVNVHAYNSLAIRKAVESNSLNIIEYFIRNDIKVSPLLLHDVFLRASEKGNFCIVRYCIENYKYDIKRALSYAIQEGHIKISKYLMDRISVNKYNSEFFLGRAVRSNQVSILKLLLKKGFNPKLCSVGSVVEAIQRNSLESVELILRSGCPINFIYIDEACYQKNLEAVKLLVDYAIKYENSYTELSRILSKHKNETSPQIKKLLYSIIKLQEAKLKPKINFL